MRPVSNSVISERYLFPMLSAKNHQGVPALTTSLSGAILFIENTGKKGSEHAF